MDVERAAAALGSSMPAYRSFASTPAGGARTEPGLWPGGGADAFDPAAAADPATADQIYPLLGSALAEARQVRVQRQADPIGFVAAPPPPLPADGPDWTAPSLAEQALRFSAAQYPSPRRPPPTEPPPPLRTPAPLPARPAPGYVGTPAAAPIRVALHDAAPPARLTPGPAEPTAAAPLAGLFNLLVQPRGDPAGRRRPSDTTG
jgi:hypothetical protein